MNTPFAPLLNILPAPQRRLWDELIDVPETFTLYGGTAVALHLGHRQSVDFDFFCFEAFDPDRIYSDLPFLNDVQVLQKKPDTLDCHVDRGGLVKVSFFSVPALGQVAAPVVADDIDLNVASLIDLAGTKAAVVQKRAEAKDYLDMDALIGSGRVDLPAALAAGQVIYGRGFNPQSTLKALSYFKDGDLGQLPTDVRDRLAAAVRAVDLGTLPALKATRSRTDPGGASP